MANTRCGRVLLVAILATSADQARAQAGGTVGANTNVRSKTPSVDDIKPIASVPAGVPVGGESLKTETLDMMPEQLMRALMPWEGHDKLGEGYEDVPGGNGAVGSAWRMQYFSKHNFHRRNPWDTGLDPSQDQPFNYSPDGMTPAHSPPYYAGDGDSPANRITDVGWSKFVKTPLLEPHAPAFYLHGHKPNGYYKDPYNELKEPKMVARGFKKNPFYDIMRFRSSRLGESSSTATPNAALTPASPSPRSLRRVQGSAAAQAHHRLRGR